jgi:hypothetical protein
MRVVRVAISASVEPSAAVDPKSGAHTRTSNASADQHRLQHRPHVRRIVGCASARGWMRSA